jgi:hypothetical protein
MAGPRGLWAALPCDAHYSEPLAAMRRQNRPDSDVYYYRALAWAKVYAQRGEMVGRWTALAEWARWPDEPRDLEAMFVGAGAVEGPKQELYLWHRFNGWILEKYEKDARRQRDKRRAGLASARARRKKASAGATRKRLQKGR